MLGEKQLSFAEYLDLLRRRWWIILIPAILGCVGAYLYSKNLKDLYTSRTLVLVDQQRVPENYVKSVVTEDIAARLGTMQEQILSRTRLQPIIEKFGLYKDEQGKASMVDLVSRLRKAITITPVKSMVSTGSGVLPGFSISVDASDPHMAQQICSQITSMFIAENLREREQSAQGTTNFLKQQLDDAKRELDDQDAKLAEFERKYMGSLPGDQQSQLNMVASLTSQLDAVTSQLYRAEQDKAYQESMLSQQISASQAASKGGEVGQDTLQRQLETLQSQLLGMETKYTPDYPDVVRLKKDVEVLKKKIAAEKATAAKTEAQKSDSGKSKNVAATPQMQQLQTLIHQNNILIDEKTREQTRLRKQLSDIQARLSMTPAIQEEYKKITRNHATALQFYNTLLNEKNQAEMATSLEQQQQGEQFSVMDPADLPDRPSFPNRPMFAGAGFGGGLALGVGIVLLIEFLDKSLRTENEVEQFLGLPTLAMVPLVKGWKGDSTRRSKAGKKKAKHRIKQAAHA